VASSSCARLLIAFGAGYFATLWWYRVGRRNDALIRAIDETRARYRAIFDLKAD